MQDAIQRYDAIVIGAGQAGGPLSTAFAGSARKTAIIEQDKVGGTCINFGCTPTKTMVASARVAYLARRAPDFGVHVGDVRVDMREVRARKQSVVDSFRSSSERHLQDAKGLDLIRGRARFTGPHTLEVRLQDGSTRQLEAGLIVINTGTEPAKPPIAGLDSVPTLDSMSIMDLDVLPEHLIVLGGGYVGLEFGQMFRRFGSRVTIIEPGKQLLLREDPDIAEEVAKVLREDGIEILCETSAERAEPANASVRLQLKAAAGARAVEGSHLLVATGRKPTTAGLNLEAAGIATNERGFVKVNERLETNVAGVYATGDVNGGPAFTHISYDDFRILRTNLIDGGSASTIDRLVPYVVYIDPQLGRVGISEGEAQSQGKRVRVAKMPMSHVARADETSETRGVMKVIVDADSDRVLGCTIFGVEGGELMSMIELAIMGQMPYTALRDGIFAHPTWAESMNNLFGMIESRN
jgi:pyruvate/2-oxoglutarate dehydrogenase complex dihydrolipoamide dehydrogenase (E3) component